MAAAVDSPGPGPTLHKGVLPPDAGDPVQPDGIRPPPEGSPCWRRDGLAATQLPADHCRVPQVPAVVTDRPPLLVVKDLHPPGAAMRAVHKPDSRCVGCTSVWKHRRTIMMGWGHMWCWWQCPRLGLKDPPRKGLTIPLQHHLKGSEMQDGQPPGSPGTPRVAGVGRT